jgi:hypothetical protein
MNRWRVLFTIGTLPIIIGAWAVFAASQAPSDDLVKVQLPSRWIPYQADYYLQMPDGPIHQKRYRAADGSLATFDVTNDIATIHNARAGRSFARAANKRSWTSHPLMPGFPGRPKTEYFVRREAFRESTEKVHGLPVLELTGTSGSLTLMVPGLNNLPLRAYDPGGKLLAEYRNIKLAVPADHLFSPPAGADIKIETAPMGPRPEQAVR